MRTRSVLVITVCLSLSLLVGAHALSRALAKQAPALAVSIFPWNGEAQERLAFSTLQVGAENGAGRVRAANASLPAAKEALRMHPLAPSVFTIAALADDDVNRQGQIVRVASNLNRRDLNLQGLALERALQNSDFPLAIRTIDQILRVNPEYSQDFMPVLLDALAQSEARGFFWNVLNGSSPWHEKFYNSALRNKATLPILANARSSLTFLPEDFDKRLISGLIKADNVAEAMDLYASLTGAHVGESGAALGWESDFPPIDWLYEDAGGFRARPSGDAELLELEVSPGKGGVIASRLIKASDRDILVGVIVSDFNKADTSQTLRMEMRCWGESDPFDSLRLQTGLNEHTFSMPESWECEYRYIEIYARAFRGKAPLAAKISKFRIEPQ